MFSLWRGGKRLGHFPETGPVMHHGRRVGAMGILVPDELLDDDCSMMQTRIEIFPGSPTFQNPVPIQIFGDRAKPRARSNPRLQQVPPMSPEAARGISADKIYEIRDENGERLDVQLVTLQLMRFAQPSLAKEWRETNGIQGEAEQFWLVSFASPLDGRNATGV